MTAAEGFVIISGFLIGYVRGFKGMKHRFLDIAIKLWKRAALLYLWAIIGTVALTAIIWYVPLRGGAPSMPMPVGDWQTLFAEAVSLSYAHIWVYFLKLYAVFLFLTPLAVYLLRKNYAWALGAISFLGLLIGWMGGNEYLQWQALFFIPAIAGFYMDTIRLWWRSIVKNRQQIIKVGIWSLAALTLVASVIAVFFAQAIPEAAQQQSSLAFSKDAMTPSRFLLALLWFTALVLLFEQCITWIDRYFGWLLLPIGTRSLTAYIVHGVVICLISYLTVPGGFVVNTIVGAIAVLSVCLLTKHRLVQKVIPR